MVRKTNQENSLKLLYLSASLLLVGTVWASAPITGLTGSLGVIPAILGLILVPIAINRETFSQRNKIFTYSIWVVLGGVFPYGLATAPKVEWAAQIGNQIDGPWLIALYMGIGFSGMVIGGAALLLNLWETRSLLRSNGDSPPSSGDH